jgi:hypothetical protein
VQVVALCPYSQLTAAGLITEAECEAYDAIQSDNNKFWIPIRWAMNVLNTARAEKRIANDFLFDKIFEVSCT